jgi:hypothetical protein
MSVSLGLTSWARYRWFESIFLKQGVHRELADLVRAHDLYDGVGLSAGTFTRNR